MTELTDDQVKALLDEMTFAMFGDGTDDTISEKLARALLTARAELDTTQTQLGDWIVRADEANVKVETLDAELARVKAVAKPAQVDWEALLIAAKRMSSDYQTSVTHHPKHVLVRREDFDALIAAAQEGRE